MNAIVSLCHFCELHGPSVVLCTQAFRDLLGFGAIVDIENTGLDSARDDDQEEGNNQDGSDDDAWKYGRINTQGTDSQPRSEASNDTCVACRSFPHSKPGYISNDDSARVTYISSQYPLQSELYILVRQACIRSLSCEVCPGKEGPIYFGDEARGHVLSYTFFLRDVQARGFQRWYSIMVLMKDKMLLLNSWPFIVKNLKEIIGNLQDSAAKIYESEESKVSHRALRSAAVMMDNSRKQRVVGQPRSLCEMVGEEGVWQHLHSSFTWLLKASGLRLQERLVEGPVISSFMPDSTDQCGGLNIQECYGIMGGVTFHQLVYNLLIGRQVVLRGNSETIVSALVKSLQPLLPKHCYRPIHFSPHYVDVASCNVLGLHSLVALPPNVLALKNPCVIDLVPKEGAGDSLRANPAKRSSSSFVGTQALVRMDSQNPTSYQDIKEAIKNYTIKVTHEGPLPARPPQALTRIESAVSNPTLSYSTLCVYLSTIIYEWVNKVKVWIHVQNTKKSLQCPLERAPPPSTSGSLQAGKRSASIPILTSATTASHSLGHSPVMSTLRSRSPGGLGDSRHHHHHHHQQEAPTHHQDEKHQLLAAISCTEWDVPLLEFWAKNFSPGSS